ncbi:hypothetical protein ACKKBG_A34965 [Auxenochlorella protothecoides x Auxenochlorella symbiontica]
MEVDSSPDAHAEDGLAGDMADLTAIRQEVRRQRRNAKQAQREARQATARAPAIPSRKCKGRIALLQAQMNKAAAALKAGEASQAKHHPSTTADDCGGEAGNSNACTPTIELQQDAISAARDVQGRMAEYGTELAGQASFDPEEVIARVAHMVLEAGKTVAEPALLADSLLPSVEPLPQLHALHYAATDASLRASLVRRVLVQYALRLSLAFIRGGSCPGYAMPEPVWEEAYSLLSLLCATLSPFPQAAQALHSGIVHRIFASKLLLDLQKMALEAWDEGAELVFQPPDGPSGGGEVATLGEESGETPDPASESVSPRQGSARPAPNVHTGVPKQAGGVGPTPAPSGADSTARVPPAGEKLLSIRHRPESSSRSAASGENSGTWAAGSRATARTGGGKGGGQEGASSAPTALVTGLAHIKLRHNNTRALSYQVRAGFGVTGTSRHSAPGSVTPREAGAQLPPRQGRRRPEGGHAEGTSHGQSTGSARPETARGEVARRGGEKRRRSPRRSDAPVEEVGIVSPPAAAQATGSRQGIRADEEDPFVPGSEMRPGSGDQAAPRRHWAGVGLLLPLAFPGGETEGSAPAQLPGALVPVFSIGPTPPTSPGWPATALGMGAEEDRGARAATTALGPAPAAMSTWLTNAHAARAAHARADGGAEQTLAPAGSPPQLHEMRWDRGHAAAESATPDGSLQEGPCHAGQAAMQAGGSGPGAASPVLAAKDGATAGCSTGEPQDEQALAPALPGQALIGGDCPVLPTTATGAATAPGQQIQDAAGAGTEEDGAAAADESRQGKRSAPSEETGGPGETQPSGDARPPFLIIPEDVAGVEGPVTSGAPSASKHGVDTARAATSVLPDNVGACSTKSVRVRRRSPRQHPSDLADPPSASTLDGKLPAARVDTSDTDIASAAILLPHLPAPTGASAVAGSRTRRTSGVTGEPGTCAAIPARRTQERASLHMPASGEGPHIPAAPRLTRAIARQQAQATAATAQRLQASRQLPVKAVPRTESGVETEQASPPGPVRSQDRQVAWAGTPATGGASRSEVVQSFKSPRMKNGLAVAMRRASARAGKAAAAKRQTLRPASGASTVASPTSPAAPGMPPSPYSGKYDLLPDSQASEMEAAVGAQRAERVGVGGAGGQACGWPAENSRPVTAPREGTASPLAPLPSAADNASPNPRGSGDGEHAALTDSLLETEAEDEGPRRPTAETPQSAAPQNASQGRSRTLEGPGARRTLLAAWEGASDAGSVLASPAPSETPLHVAAKVAIDVRRLSTDSEPVLHPQSLDDAPIPQHTPGSIAATWDAVLSPRASGRPITLRKARFPPSPASHLGALAPLASCPGPWMAAGSVASPEAMLVRAAAQLLSPPSSGRRRDSLTMLQRLSVDIQAPEGSLGF